METTDSASYTLSVTARRVREQVASMEFDSEPSECGSAIRTVILWDFYFILPA